MCVPGSRAPPCNVIRRGRHFDRITRGIRNALAMTAGPSVPRRRVFNAFHYDDTRTHRRVNDIRFGRRILCIHKVFLGRKGRGVIAERVPWQRDIRRRDERRDASLPRNETVLIHRRRHTSNQGILVTGIPPRHPPPHPHSVAALAKRSHTRSPAADFGSGKGTPKYRPVFHAVRACFLHLLRDRCTAITSETSGAHF